MVCKTLRIFANAFPVLLMVILIPYVRDDHALSLFYASIILVSFLIRYEKREWVLFVFGLTVMTIAEYLFISTGVERFSRRSFLGVMPSWLPLIWAYGFVAINRGMGILMERDRIKKTKRKAGRMGKKI